MEPKFYTAAEAADIYGLSVFTIKRWLRAGKFEGAFNAGGAAGWRIPAAAIDKVSMELAARTIVEGAAAQAAASF